MGVEGITQERFEQRLKEYRNKRDMSQDDLAKAGLPCQVRPLTQK